MSRMLTRWTFLHLAALFAAAPAVAQQNDPRTRNPDAPRSAGGSPRAVSPEHQHVSGVIIKAEKAEAVRTEAGTPPGGNAAAKSRSTPLRLTINTAAVWRDWFRDQVGQSPSASPRADAERGAESIATKGEPRTEDTEVVIEVDPGARVETLFRNVNGAASPDSATPAEARAAAEGPGSPKAKDNAKSSDSDSSASDKTRTRTSKVTRFQPEDLKPGLFVEIDFNGAGGRNRATTVAVIRPVGGLEAGRAPAEPAPAEGKAK